MTIEIDNPPSKNQPIFQMINNDSYSSEDDGNEFYESRNSFESSQEQLFSIFEPRTQESSSTINEQMSNTAQTHFAPIKNNSFHTESDTVMTVYTQEESTIETHLTLDEAITELEAYKSQSLSRDTKPMLVQETKSNPTSNHSSPELVQEEPSNNEVYTSQIGKDNHSSSTSTTTPSSSCSSSSSSVHNDDEVQGIPNQRNSPDLIDMASSPNLNEKEKSLESVSMNEKEKSLESVSLNEEEKSLKSVSSNEDLSTPELSSDDKSIEKQEEVYKDADELKYDAKDSIDENNESELEEKEEEEKKQQLFEIKNFIANEEIMTPTGSIFSHRVGKAESVEIPESKLIHQVIIGPIEDPPTTTGEKANTRTFHFKRVRLFYNKVLLKYHFAKTWVRVVFKRQPKQKKEKLQSRSAENVAITRIEAYENQRVSRSVETFTNYTASINMVEETSAPLLLPDIITPIYNIQKKTDHTIEANNLLPVESTNDVSSAAFNIMQLCEKSFYGA